ncbi:MAG: hypothetical protein UW32_C0003G0075 [Candidatus Wolfebacteria bacterium GW2011_GWE2_44_13]|uniref:Uncharacterized protein n=1 Tax=Candidatus Wolfebacteria bacterium GW2011_GWE2_44_13 TaxID=1619017 RepID=A0A0G1JG14_9BACT|nr:MAG: hypothetical protein UW32_C0003G0075 [Candidatus Wolfebacteria bacterium GW2011_GWE2_44_13]HBI25227.1 hypothetical protein [Candidatus Wolfebacteria bacterium]
MPRQLTEEQQGLIKEFGLRRASRTVQRIAGERVNRCCDECKEELFVNEDARPSQIPSLCEACEKMAREGLLALATGRIGESNFASERAFLVTGGTRRQITCADIRTVSALLSDDPSKVKMMESSRGIVFFASR